MNVLVFGPEPPQISFTQSPAGSAEFSFENERLIYLDPGAANIVGRGKNDPDILWADVYLSLLHNRGHVNLDMYSEEWGYPAFMEFLDAELRPLLDTDSERRFFDFYVDLCWESASDAERLWNLPALIPQVWVNWIHYDPKSKERADRVKEEPFRVDFVLQTNDLGDCIIFEIDGSSHFGGRPFVDQAGTMMFEASMENYTTHLRKDRWLRKQGWTVLRVSNQEVDELGDLEGFRAFLAELLDRDKVYGMRLKKPWT